jgi:hypothetical protein
MLFSKRRKDMIDIRELQKRGVVRIPKRNINIPTTPEGFVELGSTQKTSYTKTTSPETQSNTNFFGFMNNSNTKSKLNGAMSTEDQIPNTEFPSFSTESEGYNKREVDAKTSDLDNKIYKLEQRIELLEKKLDVNQQSNTGVMGW